jgi:predicted phosphodiesterase
MIQIQKLKSPTVLSIISYAISLYSVGMYFTMRPAWSGVYEIFRVRPLALIIFFILNILVILSFVLAYYRRFSRVLGVANLIFFGAVTYMLHEAWFMLTTFVYWGGRLVGWLIIVGAISALFLKYPFKFELIHKVKLPIVIILTYFTLWTAHGLPLGTGFDRGPAVFAVNETYQIVFTTRSHSITWVDVGEYRFYDKYAGSSRSETTVHKIEVPMTILDEEGGYTINARTVFYRGPYDAVLGRTHQRSFEFSPVVDDGSLRFYAISDTHDYTRNAIRTASFWGDDLDFLVLIGDLTSFIKSEADLTRALDIATGVTRGRVPVIHARGNHETKGIRANELHRYVGADGELFYYTFRIGSVWGVVLDTGEDNRDDWWEFYGTAHFDEYRRQQTEFLREINVNANTEFNAPGVTTRLAINHIPFAYFNDDDFWEETKIDWINELNQMNLDMALFGHTHRIYWVKPEHEPGTRLYLLDTARVRTFITSHFNALFVGVSTQTDSQAVLTGPQMGRSHTGLAVEITSDTIYLTYTNSRGEVIPLSDPFTGEEVIQPQRFTR